MKAGQGDEDWLRLFRLMSAEFAYSEGREYARDGREERVEEIRDLDQKLEAVQTLNTLSHAVEILERKDRDANYKPRYCFIVYDHALKQVSVKYLDGPSHIGPAFAEIEGEGQKDATQSAVVVELDKVENLKRAYPNYFGDVQLFKSSLSNVVNGRAVKEYSLPPLESVPPPPKKVPDDSWLRYPNRRNRRWTEE